MSEQHIETVDELLATYVDRLNAGETLDRSAILAEHPEHGNEVIARLEEFCDLGSDDPQPLPCATLGDYTLRRQIGRGGMGVVYEAWQNSVERSVALKVLPAGIAAEERAFMRFMREARTAAQLSHRNVVAVYGMGQEEHTPYYAMELVEGETLAQILIRLKEAEPETDTPFGKKDDPAYFGNLARVFADAADGLQHAHSKQVVHRDVKPSNLILDSEGCLRILDFGLARSEGQDTITLSGDVVGTPLYMSPEQCEKKIPVDHRTDIYSLGASLYEALTSQPPFTGKNYADTMSRIVEQDPPEPRNSNPRVPVDLQTIVLKCLRKDASARYGTAEALAQDLRRFVRGDRIEAPVESRLERILRRARRRKKALIISATMAVLILLLPIFVVLYLDSKEEVRKALLRGAELIQKTPVPGRSVRSLEILGAAEFEEDERREARDVAVKSLVFDAELADTRPIPEDFRGIAAMSADGNILAIGGRNRISVLRPNEDPAKIECQHPVEGLRLSADGQHLAAYLKSRNGVFRNIVVWRLDDLRVVFANDRLSNATFAFSPDASAIAVAHKRPVATEIFQQLSGQRRHSIVSLHRLQDAPDNPVKFESLDLGLVAYHVHYRPDGHALALVIGDRAKLRILDLDRGEITRTVENDSEILAIDWDASGRWLAVGSDSDVSVWDTRDGKRLRSYSEISAPVARVAFSPDGRFLACETVDGQLQLWGRASGSVLRFGTAILLGFSSSGLLNAVYRTDDGYEARFWEILDSPERREIRFDRGEIRGVGFIEERMLCVTSDSGVHLIDLATGNGLEASALPGEFIGFEPDSQTLLLLNRNRLEGRKVRNDGGVKFVEDQPRVLELPHQRLQHVSLAPDGTLAVVCEAEGLRRGFQKFTRWSTRTARIDWSAPTLSAEWVEVATSPSDEHASLTWSPDSRHLALVYGGRYDFQVRVLSLQEGKEIIDVSVVGPASVGFSTKSEQLVIRSEKDVAIWHLQSRRVESRLSRKEGRVLGGMAYRDGLFACSAAQNFVQLSRRPDGPTLVNLPTFELKAMLGLELSPSGRFLAAHAHDRIVLWDLRRTREALRTLRLLGDSGAIQGGRQAVRGAAEP